MAEQRADVAGRKRRRKRRHRQEQQQGGDGFSQHRLRRTAKQDERQRILPGKRLWRSADGFDHVANHGKTDIHVR